MHCTKQTKLCLHMPDVFSLSFVSHDLKLKAFFSRNRQPSILKLPTINQNTLSSSPSCLSTRTSTPAATSIAHKAARAHAATPGSYGSIISTPLSIALVYRSTTNEDADTTRRISLAMIAQTVRTGERDDCITRGLKAALVRAVRGFW